MLPLAEIATSCKHKRVNTSANCDNYRPRQPRTYAQALVKHHREALVLHKQSNLDPRGIACVGGAISRWAPAHVHTVSVSIRS